MNPTYDFLLTIGDALLYRALVQSIWSSILKVVGSTSLGEFGFFLPSCLSFRLKEYHSHKSTGLKILISTKRPLQKVLF